MGIFVVYLFLTSCLISPLFHTSFQRWIRLCTGVLFLAGIQPYLPAQSSQIDSLKSLLKEQSEAKQIETYYVLARLHQQENVDSALISLRKGLSLAQKLNLNELIIEGYNALAIHWYYRGQTDSGLAWVQKSLKILTDTPSLARGTGYSHYGLLLAQQGRYEDATLWHLQALKESETLGDSAGIVRSQHNLGRVYVFLGDIDQAVSWYKKALELSQLLGQESHSAKILGNLGQIMLNAGRLEEAFSYQTQSLSIFERLGDAFSRSITLLDLGRISQTQGHLDQARNYYDQSLAISRSILDNLGVIYTAANIASLESSRSNYPEALAYLDTTLRISREQSYEKGYTYAYEGFAEVYAKMGDYQKALENHQLYDKWNDSLANKQYLEKIRELEVKYETQQKENEILRLSEIQLQQAASIRKRDVQIQWLIISGLVIGLFLGLGWLLFRQRSRLKQQQEIFEAVAETEMNERRRIARDLHDSVGAMLATIQNRLTNLANDSINERETLGELADLLKKTSSETRQIAHNMMPEALSRFGLVIALESLVVQLNETTRLDVQLLVHGLEDRLPTSIELHLYRIIQELLHNVVKHAKGATKATLYLTRHQHNLSILLEDNGAGFDSNTSHNGMGLTNVTNRIQLLKGSLSIDSQPQQGTTINLSIPVS